MDSMFYSFHAGIRIQLSLGLWAYYLASPLNLVIALVPKSMLTMILSHLYVLKIALCCFTAAFYFRKRRGKDEIFHCCVRNGIWIMQLYGRLQLEYYVDGSYDDASTYFVWC